MGFTNYILVYSRSVSLIGGYHDAAPMEGHDNMSERKLRSILALAFLMPISLLFGQGGSSPTAEVTSACATQTVSLKTVAYQ